MDTQQDTAKRLAKHPRWRSALGDNLHVIHRYDETGGPYRGFSEDAGYGPDDKPWWPDLAHWPTVGILLGMVWEFGGTWSGAVRRLIRFLFKVAVEEMHPGEAAGELLLELWGEPPCPTCNGTGRKP
jgi:hypothetical protein